MHFLPLDGTRLHGMKAGSVELKKRSMCTEIIRMKTYFLTYIHCQFNLLKESVPVSIVVPYMKAAVLMETAVLKCSVHEDCSTQVFRTLRRQYSSVLYMKAAVLMFLYMKAAVL